MFPRWAMWSMSFLLLAFVKLCVDLTLDNRYFLKIKYMKEAIFKFNFNFKFHERKQFMTIIRVKQGALI